MAKMMRCVSPFSFDTPEGMPITVRDQDLVPDDSEAYRRAPGSFVDAEAAVRPEIEEATARPGEKRGESHTRAQHATKRD